MGIIPGRVEKFDDSLDIKIPHIGWNNLLQRKPSSILESVGDERVYFVHSYRAVPANDNSDWILATSSYGEEFVSVGEDKSTFVLAGRILWFELDSHTFTQFLLACFTPFNPVNQKFLESVFMLSYLVFQEQELHASWFYFCQPGVS